jgi:alkylation response protein AidB-like acyl-CoA dehydrogenase
MPNLTHDRATLSALRATLRDMGSDQPPIHSLRTLVDCGLDRWPLPGAGNTLARWQALATVAAHDLSLAKLFEGHVDALAIMTELAPSMPLPSGTWGTWAAESPDGRTTVARGAGDQVQLRGTKCWCSGAGSLDHGLLTSWFADGRGPQLVAVDMAQTAITVDASPWHAVGMAASASVDVTFNDAAGTLVGGLGHYLSRPGFWHGGAGIAACWYGGALSLAGAVRRALHQAAPSARSAFRLAALGKIDNHLHATLAVLRDAAAWVDAHPMDNARGVALHARLTAQMCATSVLDEAGRTLGAGAFCRDKHFARMAADLPVYVRQSHGENDFAALGEQVLALADGAAWQL